MVSGQFRAGELRARWGFALCLGLALQAFVALAQPEPQGTRTWYAESISRGEHGFRVSHQWSKGARFRSEVVVAGHRIVSIVNGDHYYTIDAVSGIGLAIRRSPEAVKADAARSRPFGNELTRLVAEGAEKVSSMELGGRSCDLYRVTDHRGRRQVCVDPARSGLPIQVETFDRKTGRTESVDYLNWLSDLPLPDAFFEPGPGVQLERLEYEEYRSRSRRERVGPAPPLYGHLLHGGKPNW